MDWLVGAIVLAAQPQFPAAAFVDSAVTAGCGDTDLPVMVDNRGLPARDAVLELRLLALIGLFAGALPVLVLGLRARPRDTTT